MHKERRLANAALLFYLSLSLLFLLLPLGSLVVSARIVLGYAFFPFIESAQAVSQRFGNVPANVLRLLNAEKENALLREKLKQAEIIESRYSAALEENKRLSQMAAFSALPQWSGIWARVIDRDPSRWNSIVSINKGTNDGVAVRAAVLGVQDGHIGLVGKIIETTRDVSKVLLITDDMSSVTGYLKDKGFDGLVEGTGHEYLRLNYMPLSAQVEIGAEVLTSPISAVFPEGVPVGRVAKFYPREDFMTFMSAEVVPAIRLSAVKEVFVITGQDKSKRAAQKDK